MDDLISREDALKALDEMSYKSPHESATSVVRKKHFGEILEKFIMQQPSAQPERYTKEELRVFQHGISLSLLSKRSAQHWQYDEETATEIKFLERLYDKVSADMKGGQG